MKDRFPDSIEPMTIPQPFVRLLEAIHTTEMSDSNRRMLANLMDDVLEDATRRRRILHVVQDSLQQLRLDMKYLIFDLEATRRERDALKP